MTIRHQGLPMPTIPVPLDQFQALSSSSRRGDIRAVRQIVNDIEDGQRPKPNSIDILKALVRNGVKLHPYRPEDGMYIALTEEQWSAVEQGIASIRRESIIVESANVMLRAAKSIADRHGGNVARLITGSESRELRDAVDAYIAALEGKVGT